MPDSLVNYLIPNLAIASLEFLFVGFLVAVLLAIRPSTSPLWRRRIWLLAMLKPFVTVLTGFFPGLIRLPAFLTSGNFLGDLLSTHGGDDGLLAHAGSGALFLQIVAGMWIVGTGVMLYRLWRRAVVSNQLIDEAKRRGYLLKPESIKVLDPSLEVVQGARIIITPDKSGPATLGAWRSVVVIPESLLPWVNKHRDPTKQERDRFIQVLRHELSHLSRRDDLATLLASITVAFFWFHPVAHWAYSRVRINNELCCDMNVVASGVCPTDYVNTLMNVVSGQFARKGFSMGILGDASAAYMLRRRLHFLLSEEVANSSADRSKWGYAIVVMMLVTLPRLIAPAHTMIEVFDADGQIVHVTLEYLEQNPSLRIVEADHLFASSTHGEVLIAATHQESGQPSSGRGAFDPAEGLAPEGDGPPAPSSPDPGVTGDGELLANPSEEDPESGDDSEDQPDQPKKKSRGQGWSGGGVGGSTPPGGPILPPRSTP